MIEEGEALILDSYCCCRENNGILRFLSTGQEPEVLTFISSYFNPTSRKLAKITYTGFSLYSSGGTLIGAIKESGVLRITTSTIGFAGDTRGIISDLTGVDTCQEFGGGLVGENGAKEKVGKILRKTKLDEIPQLLNILKGEMSFVGFRPDTPDFTKYYKEKKI